MMHNRRMCRQLERGCEFRNFLVPDERALIGFARFVGFQNGRSISIDTILCMFRMNGFRISYNAFHKYSLVE